MNAPLFRLVLVASVASAFTVPLRAQQPNAEQLRASIAIRQQRVDLLREEIKQIDARIESRLDVIVETLKGITDSKDSGTKVARMKEDTGKRLMKTINYYDQKRAALKEELRNPRLHLTANEKKKMIAIFDARIAKRTQQLLELHKSMPEFEDHEKHHVSWNEWGTAYERNKDFEQNRKMTSHNNKQRDAIVKQLDASIERLDRQNRTLSTKLEASADAVQRQALTEELAKNDALIAERKNQRLEILQPSGIEARTVALNEAGDLDKAIQAETTELSRDFTTLFQRYNMLINELSALHAAEATLANKT